MAEEVWIDKITRDKRLQQRVWMTDSAIVEWADQISAWRKAGDKDRHLPPVYLVRQKETLWLVDGWHRTAAYERAGEAVIQAEIVDGTWRDAVLASIGANAEHGIRRSNEDKVKAVTTLLQDPEWRKLSDRRLAELAGVTHPTVAKLRSTVKVLDPRALEPTVVTVTSDDLRHLGSPALARLALGWDVAKPDLAYFARRTLVGRWAELAQKNASSKPLIYQPAGAPPINRGPYDRGLPAVWNYRGSLVIERHVSTVHGGPATYTETELRKLVKLGTAQKVAREAGLLEPWATEDELLVIVAEHRPDWSAADGWGHKRHKNAGKEWAIGPVVARLAWGSLPAGSKLTDEQRAAGVPVADEVDVWRAMATRSKWWPEDHHVARRGLLAGLRQQSATPPSDLAPHQHIEWSAGHWLGCHRRLMPDYGAGLDAGLRGEDLVTIADPVRAMEFRRGHDVGARQRQRVLSHRAEERARRVCPHDHIRQIDGETRCTWCGLLDPPEALVEHVISPELRGIDLYPEPEDGAPVPAELDDATEAAEDLDDGEE